MAAIQRDSERPSTRARLLAVVFCPLYLFMVATGFSSATEAPLAVTLPAVLAGAAAVTTVLVALGVKAYRHNSRKLRFNLGTVLLLMVPLSIYLAAFRQALHTIPSQEREIGLLLTLSAFGLFLALLTTVVLLYFAEALLWIALATLRWRVRSRQNR